MFKDITKKIWETAVATVTAIAVTAGVAFVGWFTVVPPDVRHTVTVITEVTAEFDTSSIDRLNATLDAIIVIAEDLAAQQN